MNWEFGSENFSDDDVRSAFRVWGFVVIRNAFSQQEVTLVRSELDRAFGSAHLRDLPTMCSTEVLKHEAIWNHLFKECVVKSLRAALGPELCYQNDLDVQRNSYGLAGSRRHTGWHMDAGSESTKGYLKADAYRFAKCGIYLQDADNGWGGGIRVKPKSHRGFADSNPFKRKFFFVRRVANRIASILHLDADTFEVPTKAGDFCFFDSRLLHSSVPPSVENIRKIAYDQKENISGFWPEVPKEHTKYVIYWDACNAAMSGDFLRNSIKRAESELSGMSEQRFRPAVFTRFLSAKYPDDFPKNFVAAATVRDVSVSSLDTERALFYKQKLKSMRLLHP